MYKKIQFHNPFEEQRRRPIKSHCRREPRCCSFSRKGGNCYSIPFGNRKSSMLSTTTTTTSRVLKRAMIAQYKRPSISWLHTENSTIESSFTLYQSRANSTSTTLVARVVSGTTEHRRWVFDVGCLSGFPFLYVSLGQFALLITNNR